MSTLTLNDYQDQAHQYAAYGMVIEYPFIALAEETGEVLGKLAKRSRKMKQPVDFSVAEAAKPSLGDEHELREDLIKELGDVLWQLQECCSVLGVSLEQVAISNLNKLSGRKERGVIVGEGDNR